MKEFLYLSKELGFSSAVFYLFYKVKLKYRNLPYIKKWRDKNRNRVEQVYAALSILNHEAATINGVRYIKKHLKNKPHKFVYLRPYSSDGQVYNQVIVNEEYKTVVDTYNQFFKMAPVNIIDCGSNIGLAGVYFNMFYPHANIIAIEPFKENASLARLNFETVPVNNYKVLEGGIWNKNGWLSISREFRDKKEWSISLTESSTVKNDIRAFSILGIIESCKAEIDILKIDIEGSETELFNDKVYAAEFLKKVKCLAIEIHDEFNIRIHIYQVLRENNFFFYNNNEITVAINRSFLPS